MTIKAKMTFQPIEERRAAFSRSQRIH
jgi:hypothetical protein